jgi:hypothetical protein
MVLSMYSIINFDGYGTAGVDDELYQKEIEAIDNFIQSFDINDEKHRSLYL